MGLSRLIQPPVRNGAGKIGRDIIARHFKITHRRNVFGLNLGLKELHLLPLREFLRISRVTYDSRR